MTGRRILFLRTFKDDDSNYVLLNSLALALDNDDRIEVVGDMRDWRLVRAHWEKVFGVDNPPELRIDLVISADDTWRRDIHRRMYHADAIILHVSPKDLDFPQLAFPPEVTALDSDWEEF